MASRTDPRASRPPRATIASDRSEAAFDDFKPAYTAAQAKTEADRCFFCSDAPCIKACPTAIDIPQFIRKIATDNLESSARTIFESNILGMSCARVCPVETLCVGACVYNAMHVPPIQIGKLQRYATDDAFERGTRFFEAGPTSGKSVGLIGAGPASLAAAHELRRYGHACTIYERRSVVGGLNTTGVAPYKMKADRSLEEVEWVLGIGGIDVETGVAAGTDIGWSELRARHDALFLGAGLGLDSRLGVPGEDLAGVHGAVDFIERLKLGVVALEGVTAAVVVGGGNTAVDAVRELLGLGVASVTMLYRGDEAKMSGYAHEWKAARVEGAAALFRVQPTAICGESRVRAVRYVQLDADKRPVGTESFELVADLVLVAIGQGKAASLESRLPDLKLERGSIVVDGHGRTSTPGVFAGGDCANGGKEVVNAVAEGKRAAQAIDAFLRGDQPFAGDGHV